MRLSLNEYAIDDAVLIEHGMTTMPSVRNEPLEIEAARSDSRCTTSASFSKSDAFWAGISSEIVSGACLDRTRCVSTSEVALSARIKANAYALPLAPETPTIILRT